MSIKQRILYWLYDQLHKISVAKEEAARWRVLPKCHLCSKVLLMECQFCMHCGMSQQKERKTTGSLPVQKRTPQKTHLVSLYEDKKP